MKAVRYALVLGFIPVIAACAMRTLTIHSQPTGANVAINDNRYGVTPLDVDDIVPGVYSVAVSKDGYLDWRSDIEVTGSQRIMATLSPAPVIVTPPVVREIVTEARETRLSVFVEPEGAAVIVDGQSRGGGSPAAPVTISFPYKPTAAEVRVELPGFVTWEEQVPLQPDRDNRIFVKLSHLPEWYEFTTDASFLRRVVDRTVAKIVGAPALKVGRPIAIVPMDKSTKENLPLTALIQDAFTQVLTMAGYVTAEREDELLIQLAHSSSGDSLPLRVLTRHDRDGDRPFDYDAELATREKGEFTTVTKRTTRTGLENGDMEVIETETKSEQNRAAITGHVATADQIVAYRVLECGLSKSPVVSGPERPEQMLFRLGKVRLHVRIIDAKSGVTTWAGPLEGEAVDEIPVRVNGVLGAPPSEQYYDIAPGTAYPPPRLRARAPLPE